MFGGKSQGRETMTMGPKVIERDKRASEKLFWGILVDKGSSNGLI